MRVLVLFAHPVETSFGASAHREVLAALEAGGHEVDDCDLYAEDFNPVLSRQERLDYHDCAVNRAPVQAYVARLERAEALVIVSPIWNYGFPAILKGFFDRVFLPGVSFDLKDGKLRPILSNIKKLVMVTSYGGTRLRTFIMGDPPRRIVNRQLRVTIKPFAPVRYLALYDMDNRSDEQRQRFLGKVRRLMARL